MRVRHIPDSFSVIRNTATVGVGVYNSVLYMYIGAGSSKRRKGGP